jgi:hypothetical protein
VVLLAYGLRRTKLDDGLTPSLEGRHAGTDVLLRLRCDMFGHLVAQALVCATPRDGVREANEKAAQELHARSAALTSKKRAMIAAVCSQSRVSDCNCLRPAAVRR